MLYPQAGSLRIELPLFGVEKASTTEINEYMKLKNLTGEEVLLYQNLRFGAGNSLLRNSEIRIFNELLKGPFYR